MSPTPDLPPEPDASRKPPASRIRSRWFVLGAIPPVVTLLLARHLALPLPVFDYWDALWASFHYHDLGSRAVLDYYLEPFVDQQMLFPKVVIDRLANWTANRHYELEILLGWLAQCGTLLIVWVFVHRSRIQDGRSRVFAVLASSLLLFWPFLLFRFQHHWYSTQYSLVVFPGLLCLLFLRLGWGRWRGLLAAMVPAGVAACSHGTGATVVLAVSATLLISPAWKRGQKAAWLIFAAVVVAGIWWVSASSALSPSIGSRLASLAPLRAVTFFLGCFAPRIVQPALGALLFGLSSTGLLVLHRRGRLKSAALFPWLTIFTWCVITAAVTTVHRCQGGFRPNKFYFSFFVLFFLTTVILILLGREAWDATAAGRAGSRIIRNRWTARIALILFVLVYGIGIRKGIDDAVERCDETRWSLERLAFAPLLVDRDLRYLFPLPRLLVSTLPALDRRGVLPPEIDFSPFARSVPGRFTPGPTLGLEPMAGPPGRSDVHHYRVTGSHPRLDLRPASPLPRDQVIALDLDPTVAEHAVMRWDDGSGWKREAEIFLSGRCRDGRTCWIFFHDQLPGRSRAPVQRLQLAWPGRSPADLPPVLRIGPARIRCR